MANKRISALACLRSLLVIITLLLSFVIGWCLFHKLKRIYREIFFFSPSTAFLFSISLHLNLLPPSLFVCVCFFFPILSRGTKSLFANWHIKHIDDLIEFPVILSLSFRKIFIFFGVYLVCVCLVGWLAQHSNHTVASHSISLLFTFKNTYIDDSILFFLRFVSHHCKKRLFHWLHL